MPDSKTLLKATLVEMDSELKQELPSGKKTTVQFNPETLKVTYSNSLSPPQGQNNQKGTPSMLFVGGGTSKLTLTLWFDATAPIPAGALPNNAATANDVALLTQQVSYFITPSPSGDTFTSPAVKFVWGTFSFAGVMDSLDESLEFFSPDGRPLRASINLSISQQKIQIAPPTPGPGQPALPGTRPLATAAANQSLQSLAASQGLGGNWQSIAAANGITNPRLLSPGTLIDLQATVTTG
jgi:hypothetical protein